MNISLIITTYNWKEALALSLRSVFEQICLPSEVIVADDGSRPDTKEMLQVLSTQALLPIIHSWQEDKGFRLARSRNRAIAKATGEYIILIDGDIILEPHFVADHQHFARPGYFAQGSRVLLDAVLSEKVLRDGRLHTSFCSQGVENRKNCIRSPFLARVFSFHSRRIKGVKTCNFAFWRQDALTVNGFNEEFEGWGREDSEFTARLLNQGVQRRNIKFNALGYHLYHPMHDRGRVAQNDAILEKTIRQRLVWCERGISQYLESTSPAPLS